MEEKADKFADGILREETCVMGLPFDIVESAQAISHLKDVILHNRKCFLSTPNLNFTIASQHKSGFRQSVLVSDLSVPDGMPIIWVAKIIGEPLSERVAGSSLFDSICSDTSENKISVFFFGGDEGVAKQAEEKLNQAAGGAYCVGSLNPGRGSIESMSTDSVRSTINAANPDFLVVSLGAAKGQDWILRNQDSLNTRVISHLGAVVNFVAGNVTRAPKFWQATGAEWIWRIIQEPFLVRRYVEDGLRFLGILIRRVIPLSIYVHLIHPFHRHSPFSYSITEATPSALIIDLKGNAIRKDLESMRLALHKELTPGQHIYLDFSKLSYADGSFFALVMRLSTIAEKGGGKLHIQNIPPTVSRLADLHLMRLNSEA